MEPIDCEATAEGVILFVQAQPGARRNGVVGVHAGRLKVAVTQVAERGKANAALGVKRSQVTLVSGPTSSQKRFLVTGMTPEAVAARIGAVLERIERR